MYSERPFEWYMIRPPKLNISWRRGKQYTSSVTRTRGRHSKNALFWTHQRGLIVQNKKKIRKYKPLWHACKLIVASCPVVILTYNLTSSCFWVKGLVPLIKILIIPKAAHSNLNSLVNYNSHQSHGYGLRRWFSTTRNECRLLAKLERRR